MYMFIKEIIMQKYGLNLLLNLPKIKGFSEKELNKIISITKKNEDEFKTKYQAHIS